MIAHQTGQRVKISPLLLPLFLIFDIIKARNKNQNYLTISLIVIDTDENRGSSYSSGRSEREVHDERLQFFFSLYGR